MEFLKLLFFTPAVILLLFTGLYLSIKARWIQIFKLPLALSLINNKNSKEKISSLAALCTILGGNLGVGNISGTAIALKNGGPGFILWMIIIIIVTSIVKYVTCYLSISHRVKIGERYIGGPMSYLQNAYKTSKITLVFILIMVICAITVGNLVQVNSLSIPMHLINKPPIIAALIMAVVFFAVTILSLGNIARLISSIVPAMAIAYVVLSIVVLCKFHTNIIPSLRLIFSSFINLESLKNGLIGAFILETFHIVQIGTLRGIFATDIGLGLEGIVHSSVGDGINDHIFKVKQSLITIISPFIVVIITFITTMIILVTNALSYNVESTNVCITAFKLAINSVYIDYVIMVIMFCFAFTTIFTWFLCATSTIRYVCSNNIYIKIWTVLFTIVIPIGALGRVSVLWDIADISISVMIIINTVGILILLPKNKEMFFFDGYQMKSDRK